MVELKDALDWCFTVASVYFGVFGFLYAIYVNTNQQTRAATGSIRPAIIDAIILFCRVLACLIIVLTATAAVTSYRAQADWAVWTIVGTFVIVTGLSLKLAWSMV